MSTISAAIGRILLAVIFILSGAGKLMNPAVYETMITGAGMPAGLAIPAGAFEVLAGLALAFGLMTRLAAVLLVAFVALATVLFHNRLTDPVQQAQALKNLAIMGGLLLVFAHSQMRWSWDTMRRDRRSERERLEAESRVRDAELRAARAEGKIEGARSVPSGQGVHLTDVDRDDLPEVRR